MCWEGVGKSGRVFFDSVYSTVGLDGYSIKFKFKFKVWWKISVSRAKHDILVYYRKSSPATLLPSLILLTPIPQPHPIPTTPQKRLHARI